eukprot:6632169-Ditylum_brightwellii.AAC.1
MDIAKCRHEHQIKGKKKGRQSRPTPNSTKIEHKIWSIYIQDNQRMEKVSTELGNILLWHIEGNAIKKYWTEHFILHKGAHRDIG